MGCLLANGCFADAAGGKPRLRNLGTSGTSGRNLARLDLFRRDGQRTVGFEIVDVEGEQVGHAVDVKQVSDHQSYRPSRRRDSAGRSGVSGSEVLAHCSNASARSSGVACRQKGLSAPAGRSTTTSPSTSNSNLACGYAPASNSPGTCSTPSSLISRIGIASDPWGITFRTYIYDRRPIPQRQGRTR